MEIAGMFVSWSIIWVVVAIIFGIIEAFTMGLATIWFCGGAVVAALVAMIGAPPGVQISLFFIVSIVLLYFTRPLAQRKLNVRVEKTNSDALIGEQGIVTEAIIPFNPGQVKIQGKEWLAISESSDLTIDKGSKVTVHKIEGVKLVVIPFEEEKTEV